MAGWLIVIISAGYLAVLFGVAYWGGRRADAGRSVIANGTVYALSLAVYATSWTFYGSVGRAVGTGAGFLPIYLGPTIMAAFWWFLLRSMIRSSKRHRITSIADLVAHRYGNSAVLGGLVTVVAVVGIVPYIALQLKAVSDTFSVLRGGAVTVATRPEVTPVLQDTALYVALFLAAQGRRLPMPADVATFGYHSYKLYIDHLSWNEAQRQCARMGGQLAVVESAEENAFLAALSRSQTAAKTANRTKAPITGIAARRRNKL